MKFHLWYDEKSNFLHECIQIKNLIEFLKKWSEEYDIETHLLTNSSIGGEEIDAIIIVPNNIIIVDLKTGSGTIEGQEMGEWKCIQAGNSEFIINSGKKNPLLQGRDKKWATINYLDEKEEIFLNAQKASQMSFGHTSCFVVFDGNISWDKNQIPRRYWPWFDVLSMDKLAERINSIRSKVLDLSPEEAWRISTLINSNNKDEEIKKNSYRPGLNETVNGLKKLIQGSFIGIDTSDKSVILIKTHDKVTSKVFLNSTFLSAAADLKKLLLDANKLIDKEIIDINLRL
jgi:hypothetical protein